MRRSQMIMGTGVSVDIPGSKEDIFEKVFECLREIDRKFSPYKEDSEVSKYRRGELREAGLSVEMKFVLHACRKAEEKTNGYFSAWYGSEWDPSGYVKGWAIEKAGMIIKKSGYRTFCVSIGGDLQAASDGSKKWSIGIQDPTDKSKILDLLSISNSAMATSGNYERGIHIINPKTSKPATDLLSLSVVGPGILEADILATAGFAAGKNWREVLAKFAEYEALAVRKNMQTEMTAGFEAHLSHNQGSNQT